MATCLKKIAIITSGGDAPGMNAAIRACVIHAANLGFEIIGYKHGYNGIINGEVQQLSLADVNNIIHLGGTILKSARCPQMHTQAGLEKAVATLEADNIDALIVIGGDGSFHGLSALKPLWQGQLIGLPGTIDNDIYGTDSTIGFATSVDTALSAIDKIRDTADAFDRIFIVELMGRHSGHITFNVGLASGCEKILSFENTDVTEPERELDKIAYEIQHHKDTYQSSYIICIAENLWPGGSQALAKQLMTEHNIDATVCILGHIQRGGSPVARDRVLATHLGIAAIEAVAENASDIMVGMSQQQPVYIAIEQTYRNKKAVNSNIVQAQAMLMTPYLPKTNENSD